MKYILIFSLFTIQLFAQNSLAGIHVVGNGSGLIEIQMISTWEQVKNNILKCQNNLNCHQKVIEADPHFFSIKDYELLFVSETTYPSLFHKISFLENNKIYFNTEELYRKIQIPLYFNNEEALNLIFDNMPFQEKSIYLQIMANQ